jgi:hypothetical protein
MDDDGRGNVGGKRMERAMMERCAEEEGSERGET